MRIVLIGGHDRMHQEYKGVGVKQGCSLKVYTQKTVEFEKAIGYPDGIVLFTSTVSHEMMHIAVKVAKHNNIPILRSHTSSASSLTKVLRQFTHPNFLQSY